MLLVAKELISMIDLRLLRDEPDRVITLLKNKDLHFDAHKLVVLDEQRRALMNEVEHMRHKKNEFADYISQHGLTDELRAESSLVGKQLKALEKKLHEVEQQFHALYLACPNITFSDVPVGGKEANIEVSIYGHKPTFSFPVKNHLDLGAFNGWFDFDVAAEMSGSNFVLYKDDGVRLIYALTMFMLSH